MDKFGNGRLKKFIPLFFFLAILSFNEWGKSFANYPETLRYYLNDLIAIPTMLFMLKCIISYLPNFIPKHISISNVFYTFLITSVYFECLLPIRSQSYTADFVDILCYAMGAFVFLFIQNKMEAFTVSSSWLFQKK